MGPVSTLTLLYSGIRIIVTVSDGEYSNTDPDEATAAVLCRCVSDLMLARKVQLLAELAAEGGAAQRDHVQTVLKRPDAALGLRMFPRYTGQDL